MLIQLDVLYSESLTPNPEDFKGLEVSTETFDTTREDFILVVNKNFDLFVVENGNMWFVLGSAIALPNLMEIMSKQHLNLQEGSYDKEGVEVVN